MKLSASLLIASTNAVNPSERWESLKYENPSRSARATREGRTGRCTGQYENLTNAIEFLETWNNDAQKYFNEESEASWAYATDINEENQKIESELAQKTTAWMEEIGFCAQENFRTIVDACKKGFGTTGCNLEDEVGCVEDTNEDYQLQCWTKEKQLRGLDMLQDLGYAALGADSDEYELLTSALGRMSVAYSTTKVKDQNSDRQHPLDPDLTAIFKSSCVGDNAHCDYLKQRYYWDAWNTKVGQACHTDYEIFVKNSNKAAVANGFANTGESWRSKYIGENNDTEIQALFEKIWTDDLKELYEEIHAYARFKLNARYGDKMVGTGNNPTPEHLFGNMWAQTWGSLYDVAVPHPDAGERPDATPAIEKLTEEEMFDYADEFFRSLGLTPMTKLFWRNSVIKKKPGVDMVCHASAWDFMSGDGNSDDGAMGDYRIKQCTVKDQDDFVTVHHEMGHIQYYQQYAHHPIIFRSGANPGFHEAIGDTLALSVSTPKHLIEVGLLEDPNPAMKYLRDEIARETSDEDMNYLMSILLDKVTFLPFGYLMDKFRWEIFATEPPKEKYQEIWDSLRLKYQGMIPPLERSEEHFDAAGKYHIPNNTPYIRYYVSFILQFQFYEKMCLEAGEYVENDPEKPLYKCDFFNSKQAGRIMKDLLKAGQSQPWETTLKNFLCSQNDSSCTGDMNAKAITKYFLPVMDWLKKYRAANNYDLGWDENWDASEPETWVPCEYNDAAPSCGEPTEPCSTQEDWDESWNTDGPTTTTATTTTTTSDASAIAAVSAFVFALLFL